VTLPKLPSERRQFWTPYNVNLLVSMCEGKAHSLLQMAEVLGTTRNAISGKMNKLGLVTGRSKSPVKRPKPKFNPNAQPSTKTSSIDMDALYNAKHTVSPTAQPWLERSFGQCAFPFAVGDETYSCCKPSNDTGYCDEHCDVMYEEWKPARPRHPQLKTDGRFA
jgi:hypothetical protein